MPYQDLLHDHLIQTQFREILLAKSQPVNPTQGMGCPACIFVHTVSRENTQKRLKQCDSWKAMQIIFVSFIFCIHQS